MLETILINLASKRVRHEVLEGRKYLVVPMVMMTEGVHAGNKGPLYYPEEEFAKTPVVWNHKPIIVYHPMVKGQSVSACDPVIMEAHKVGLILNTVWDGKLRAEAWLEEERLLKIDPRVHEAIQKGQLVEVSTGLFTDNEAKAGEFKGKKYIAIARNYRPDHLAILPDCKGACSIADGAGLMQTNQDGSTSLPEMTFQDIHMKLCQALATAYGEPGKEWAGWVVDAFPSKVIYMSDGTLYAVNYSISAAGEVTFDGEPAEVMRTTEYKTTDGEYIGNMGGMILNQRGEGTMTREERVKNLITANVGWTDADKDFLMTLPDEKLDKIEKSKTPVPVTPPVNPPVVPPVVVPVPANNNQQLTMEQWLAQQPPQFREIMVRAIRREEAEKAQLIDTIVANQSNTFTKEYLQVQTTEVLQALARLAGSSQTNNQQVPPLYLGAATVPPTVNQQPVLTPLPLPVMDFGKK